MYAINNNSGYVSGDPHDYLYLDINDAKYGDAKWLTYDEMRKDATDKYDTFADETCYGYNWDYDMENYIPALKEYANAQFYNKYIGMTDYYGAFKQYISYGDYPDFEDDEWWDTENELVKEGEDQYRYLDDIVFTPKFQQALYEVLLEDDTLQEEFEDNYEGTDYTFEDVCHDIAFNGYVDSLLRDNALYGSGWYRVTVDGNSYYVDGDAIWDLVRYW